jgi:hypothetical protein
VASFADQVAFVPSLAAPRLLDRKRRRTQPLLARFADRYSTYWKRYIEPRVGNYALRDFTIAIVASLLKDIAATHKLNKDTVTKIRSVLSGIFSYAMSEGHFPARSAADNPASRARIPETASAPKRTIAATFEEVQGYLAALKGCRSSALPSELWLLAESGLRKLGVCGGKNGIVRSNTLP